MEGLLIKDQIDKYLSDTDLKPQSRTNYRYSLSRYVEWLTLNVDDVHQVTKADLIRYKQYLINKGLTALSIDSELSPVRNFYKYLSIRGQIPEYIGEGIHSPKRYDGYRRGHLSESQVIRLLSSIPQDDLAGMRDYVIVSIMIQTGMRVCEVSRLNVGDFGEDPPGTYFVNVHRKRVHDKVKLGIEAQGYKLFCRYLEMRTDSPGYRSPAFVTNQLCRKERLTPVRIGRIVAARLIAAGVKAKNITAHSLRHTAAVIAHKHEVSLYDIQLMLGHRSVETTTIYLSSAKEENSLHNPAVKLLTNLFFKSQEQ